MSCENFTFLLCNVHSFYIPVTGKLKIQMDYSAQEKHYFNLRFRFEFLCAFLKVGMRTPNKANEDVRLLS